MQDENILFTLKRGVFTEVVVQGEILVHNGREVLYQTRESTGSYPARSLLKPFQFMATGLAKSNPMPPRYVASLGSISGSNDQIRQIEEWYDSDKLCALVKKLRVPPTFPMDEKHRLTLKALDEKPSQMFHTCFSKHMSILEACEKNGWDMDHYHENSHPYFGRLLRVLSEVLQEDLKTVATVRDGCLLPSPVMTLAQMGKLYHSLALTTPGTELYVIQQLMLQNPEWIGGIGRADTKLMQKNPSKVLAKEGADGLLGLSIAPSERHPSGLGIILKLWAGYHPKLSLIALSPILQALDLKEVHEIPSGQDIEFHFEPFRDRNRKIYDISPLINEKLAVWPEDKNFKRTVSLDTQKGNHLTLSHIETTLHLGSHTDGPNHFFKTDKGIDTNELSPYGGICQLLEFKKKRGELIERKDLESLKILAKRVLIKTGSYPDPQVFNTDFNALSECAMEYLSELGVILVGIDTPSIDTFASKDLQAHHASGIIDTRILEGIVLNKVTPGLYLLSCFPLKIEHGDASPVRAVLTPVVC